MPVSLTHATVATGTDAGNGEIRKAQWNANHTLTGTANQLLGFDGSGNAVSVDPAAWPSVQDNVFYYTVPHTGLINSAGTQPDSLIFTPLVIDSPTNIDGIAINVVTAVTSGAFRLGLYRSRASGLGPGVRVFGSGALSSATTGLKQELFTSIPLARGTYWVCLWNGTINAAFSCGTNAEKWGGVTTNLTASGLGYRLSRFVTYSAVNPFPADETAQAYTIVNGQRFWLIGLRSAAS